MADERFCFPLPDDYPDVQAAPLLCAGLIGYRALGMAGDAARLGLYGFGAAAHIIAQVARHQGREVFAFTRAGDARAQAVRAPAGRRLGRRLGRAASRTLDAALIFAPAGALVPRALRPWTKGGRVVCAGIHMSDMPSFPYELLWGSAAALGGEPHACGRRRVPGLAPAVPVHTEVEAHPLAEANVALERLRVGCRTRGGGAGAVGRTRAHPASRVLRA